MKPLYPWAMLATNYDDVHINWPMYVQPKLNGVRAKWDVERQCLVSRQGKVIPEKVLPTLYRRLKLIFPSNSLDGELWSPDMSFQELCGAVNGKRKTPHEKENTIRLYVFDTISKEPSPRIPSIDIRDFIPTYRCDNPQDFEDAKKQWGDSRYDGLILRVPGAPYIVGRTEALIKWKPWKYCDATILECLEGTGKFKGMLGAFSVSWDKKVFKVGGGNITEEQRKKIWSFQKPIFETLQIRYRELSRDGIPLQPQIVKL